MGLNKKVSIIAIISGICIFIGAFFGCGALISLIVSGFTDPNWRTAIKIILWVLAFPAIFAIAVSLGGLVAALIIGKLDKYD